MKKLMKHGRKLDKKNMTEEDGESMFDPSQSTSSAFEVSNAFLVEHQDKGHTHRRIVKFYGSDIDSLKSEIIKIYKDIIPAKIAHAARVSEDEAWSSSKFYHLLCLSTYNEKFKQNIDLLEIDDIENGKIVAEIKPFHVINKKTSGKNGEALDEDAYDIAVQIKDMKVHIHASEGGHRFIPYWEMCEKLVPANGMFPPGVYQIWCPVYSAGQGYISVGKRKRGSITMYDVSITGMATINPPSSKNEDKTGVRFVDSPSGDANSRIKFESNGAILCYRHSDGEVLAVEDPEKAGKDYQYDFLITRMDSPFEMYWQIYKADGDNKNGISHYLSATNTNTLLRVKQEIDTEYKDPSSMFSLYRTTTSTGNNTKQILF